ncbi:MAG: ATP-binding protein [Bacteroidales bacterium]|nr:ATP-binding protein [Bacteroidales bacterium]
MDELQQILENSKLTGKSIKDNLLHPILKKELNPREVFDDIKSVSKSYFEKGSAVRMVGLAGLRGVGKTTLLWQSANYIYENYTKNIYFFHLGDLKNYNIGIREIHKGFEKYFSNGKLWSYKEKIVFLFDEIHEDPNWASDLKIFYDLFPIAFAVATGSSALLLQSTADLVTRMLIQHVYPLNFREYINISHSNNEKICDTRDKLQDIILLSETADDLFHKLQAIKPSLDNYLSKIDNTEKRIYDYIVYKNIIRFLLIDSKYQINEQIKDLVRRVIYEDIPKINENSNPKHAEKILNRLAASDEINIQTLSQTIGISQDKINENLDILEKAELLNVLYPYGGIDSKINKMKKYFFMSPSIRKALLNPLMKMENDSLYAKMLEDTIVLYFKRIFRDWNNISFSSAKGQKNPDLIIETIPNPILLEIGINKNTTKQISKSRIKYKYGIVINSKADKIEFYNDIVILPLKYFLLL